MSSDRHQREVEQAKILAREILQADAEGRETKWPAERDRRLARSLPTLTREEAYRRHEEREQNREERRRARNARAGAKTRGSYGRSRLTPADLLAKSNGRCYLCQTPLTTATAQTEHIIPISRGGQHVDENLAAACAPCNSEKGSKIVAFNADTRKPRYLG